MNRKILPCLILLSLFSCERKKDFVYTSPASFELPQYDPLSDTLMLCPVKVQNRYGYIDQTGKMIIDPQFEQAYDFEEGIAQVRLFATDNAYIDKKGNIIWRENDASGYSKGMGDFSNGLLSIIHYKKYEHKYGYVNRNGKIVIPPFFDKAWPFHENMARVCVYDPPVTSEEEKKNLISGIDKKKRERWGFINTKGELVVPFSYNEVHDFENGYAHVIRIDESDIKDQYIIMSGGRHGFIDKTGRKVIPLIYEDAQSFSEGLAPVKWNGKWGFINEKGVMVIPPLYDMAEPFVNGMAKIRKKDPETYHENYGFINKNGQHVIPCKYDFALDFVDNLACVSFGEKYGCINKQGEWVIEPVFDGLIHFSEGIGLTKFEDKTGYIDTNGLWIAMPVFDDGLAFNNGLAAVVLKGRYYYADTFTELGYINKEGQYIWEPKR